MPSLGALFPLGTDLHLQQFPKPRFQERDEKFKRQNSMLESKGLSINVSDVPYKFPLIADIGSAQRLLFSTIFFAIFMRELGYNVIVRSPPENISGRKNIEGDEVKQFRHRG